MERDLLSTKERNVAWEWGYALPMPHATPAGYIPEDTSNIHDYTKA